jgi:hypothetical protein
MRAFGRKIDLIFYSLPILSIGFHKQYLIAERGLATLDAKRKALQNRIRQLMALKQSITDEELLLNRLSESTVANNSTQEQKTAFSGPCAVAGKMSSQGVSTAMHRKNWLLYGLPECVDQACLS